MSSKPYETNEGPLKQVPSRFVVPASLSTQRVTRFVLQQQGADEFVLSFFEVRLPIIIGDKEERELQISAIDHVDEVCVGRFVLPAGRLVEMANLLVDYVKDHELKGKEDAK
jgi:hypothetical protein